MAKMNWAKNEQRRRISAYGSTSVTPEPTKKKKPKKRKIKAGKMPQSNSAGELGIYKSTSPFQQGSGRRQAFGQEKGNSGKKKYVVRELTPQTKIVSTKQDRGHFGRGLANEEAFLDDTGAAIRSLVQNGIKSPREQAAALNRMGKRTATRGRWNTRLIILFYERMNRLRRSRGLPEIGNKRPPKTFTIIEEVADEGWRIPKKKRNKAKKKNAAQRKRKLTDEERRERQMKAKQESEQRSRAREAAQNVVVERVQRPRKVTTDNRE